MTTLVALLEVALPPLLLFVALWVATGIGVVLLHASVRPLLASVPPRPRRWLLLAAAVLPLPLAAVTTLLAMTVRSGGALTPPHCHDVLGCASHLPGQLVVAGGHGLLAAAVAAVFAVLLLRTVEATLRARRVGRLLQSLPRRRDARGFWIVECTRPLALSTGLLRGEVYLSSALLAAVDDRDVEVIAAHESAHLRRHDNLWLIVAAMLFCPLSVRHARALLADLRVCAEQLADADAAARSDADQVARTLLRVYRIALRGETPGLSHFGASSLEQRIDALLVPQRHPLRGVAIAAVMIALVLAATLAGIDAGHHLLEAVLGPR